MMTLPIHGNYHGYYSKRPSIRDPRLALLPPELLRDARVLDVGCNEGFVTCEIAQSYGAKRVVGVDIDDTLVRVAWKRRRTVWSCQQPVSEFTLGREAADPPRKRRRHDYDSKSPVVEPPVAQDYFPASLEHMFGPLPVPPTRDKHTFPHNVSFRTADWINDNIPEDVEGYTVVIALSLTKWVHLNGGDEALNRFFRRVYDVLKPGGSFVLEPQAWETYAKAKRMDNRLKENAKSLCLRPEQFDALLKEIGFGPPRRMGSTGEGGFCRPLDVYDKL